MKLRNKKTGEIVDTLCQENAMGIAFGIDHHDGNPTMAYYNSLAKLNKEWEDYEEPKTHWMIDTSMLEPVREIAGQPYEIDKEIGNWFETKEEAEKAVERLRAWKRLKDTYFIRFDLDFVKNTISFTYRIDGTLHSALDEERIVFEDMKTIFGGRE